MSKEFDLMPEEFDASSRVGDDLLESNLKKYMGTETEFDLGKTLWLRFLRGAIAGAVSAGATMTFTGQHTFTDLKAFIYTLSISLIVGALSGMFLSIDKFLRVK